MNSAGDRNYINSKDLYCGGEATSTWAAGTVKDAMEHCDQTPGCVAIAYNKQRRNYRGMTSLTTSYHDAGFDCYSVEGKFGATRCTVEMQHGRGCQLRCSD